MHIALYYARRFPSGEEKGSRRWGNRHEGNAPPTPEELEHEFGCMYSGEWTWAPISDKRICERLFEDTNNGNSRYWFGQDKAAKVGHTSMSVGDVVSIGSQFYQCMPCGFERIDRRATAMQVRCMFCNGDMGTIDGHGETGPSHGAHPACLEREWGVDMTGAVA